MKPRENPEAHFRTLLQMLADQVENGAGIDVRIEELGFGF